MEFYDRSNYKEGHLMRRAVRIFTVILGLLLTACVGAETSQEKLAVAEVQFQGLQITIQELIKQGVITEETAGCVETANAAAKAALDRVRSSVRLELGVVESVIGSMNAAVAVLASTITKLQKGENPC
jgi:multidrug resistance efflux pump